MRPVFPERITPGVAGRRHDPHNVCRMEVRGWPAWLAEGRTGDCSAKSAGRLPRMDVGFVRHPALCTCAAVGDGKFAFDQGFCGTDWSFTLIAAAAGGVVLGIAADRYGRTRALMISVLLYAVFTAACGLAWSFASLAGFRILLGFDMGGEWAAGAALVSET